jgi:hypothetical protein
MTKAKLSGSQKTELVRQVAILLGYKGKLLKDLDVFMADQLGRSVKLVQKIRGGGVARFGVVASNKLKELLKDNAQHLDLTPICNFGLEPNASGTAVSDKADPKKRRRRGKKRSRSSKVAATAAPKATSTVSPSPATQKPVVATTAAPAPTPKAGVVPSASVLEISGSDGRKIMITEVMHEGSLHSAILLPVGSDLSVTSGKTGFTITVK